MFEVKLGTGKTFTVTAVDERWQAATEFNEEGYNLTLEATPADKELAEYVEMLLEEGALGIVTVSADGKECAVYSGYESVSDASVRLLPTGEKSANITLHKAAE